MRNVRSGGTSDAMRRAGSLGAVLAVVALLSLSTAYAELAPQWKYCSGDPGIDWDTQIRNCTTLLQSGRETSKNRSVNSR